MAVQQARKAKTSAQTQPLEISLPAHQRNPQNHPLQHERRQTRQTRAKSRSEEQLAKGLGWFSIGLGFAEVLAPRGLARLIGVRGNHDVLFRLLGLREIASGIGILTQRRPAAWLWSRVAGDAMDLSLLGAALSSDQSNRARVAIASAAVIGVTALDIIDARQLSHNAEADDQPIRVKSVTINRSPEEAYRFWRDFQNFPRFMSHLESVRMTGEKRSHWIAKGPAGTTVEWDAEIIEDVPNQLIAWRSLEGADVENCGSVRFTPAPGGRGTEVRAEIEYTPPGGAIGVGIAKLFGEEPEQQMKDDLYHFKQVMETGEVVKSDASLHWGPHPAQPPAS
jgi:uncharacterized membrane protein